MTFSLSTRTVALAGALALAGCGGAARTSGGAGVLIDARALAVDPTGRVWIADAGRRAVVSVPSALDPGALLLDRGGVRVYGGPGDGASAFLEPAALDPTNGLAWWVADAGTGQLHRVSFEGRLLETLNVGAEDRASRRSGRSGSTTEDPARPSPTGRPVAVASAASGEVYAIDEARSAVLRWDRSHGRPRVIGSPETGAVRRPVALALLPDGDLLVADAGRAEVLRFDAFGTLRGVFAAVPARALAVAEGRVWLTTPDSVAVYAPDGARLGALPRPPDTAPLVGASVVRGEVVGLTRTGLVRLGPYPQLR